MTFDTVFNFCQILYRSLAGLSWWLRFPRFGSATIQHRWIVSNRGLTGFLLQQCNSISPPAPNFISWADHICTASNFCNQQIFPSNNLSILLEHIIINCQVWKYCSLKLRLFLFLVLFCFSSSSFVALRPSYSHSHCISSKYTGQK